EVDRNAAIHFPARCIERRLRLLPVIDEAHERLHVPLWLYRAAHHPEARVRGAIARDEPGDDGVERTLAGPDLIGVAGLQREPGSAILQTDARPRDHDARAEAHVVRLDERHHHAVRVGSGQIHRPGSRRRAVLEILSAAALDQAGAAREGSWIEELSRRYLHSPEIAYVVIEACKR